MQTCGFEGSKRKKGVLLLYYNFKNKQTNSKRKDSDVQFLDPKHSILEFPNLTGISS